MSEDRKLLDFVQGLYAFQSVASLTERVCQELTPLIGAENTMICTHDGVRRIITSVVAQHAFSRANLMPQINESGMMALHPFWEDVFDARRRVRAISDVTTRAGWHRNPLYGEVFSPDGIEDQLNIEFLGTPDRFMTLNVMRGRRGFSVEERTRFLRLAEVIAQAFENARLAEQAGLVHAPSEGMLRIRVDAHGGMLRDQEDTESALVRFFGAGGGLPGPVMDWVGAQARKLNQGYLENVLPPLAYRHGFQQWMFSLHRNFAEYGYILCARANAMEAGGMSMGVREESVMRLVVEGKTNEEVARKLGVSVNTVKTHLKRVFFKLGVKNRTEAAQAWRRRGWCQNGGGSEV